MPECLRKNIGAEAFLMRVSLSSVKERSEK